MPIFGMTYVEGGPPEYLPRRVVEYNGRQVDAKPQFPVLIQSPELDITKPKQHWLFHGAECTSGMVEILVRKLNPEFLYWELVESRLSIRVGDLVQVFHLDHIARPDVEKTVLNSAEPR